MGFKIRENGHFKPTNEITKLDLTFQLNRTMLFLGIYSIWTEIVTNLVTENWWSKNFGTSAETNLPGFVNPNPNPKPGFGLESKPETRVYNLAGFCNL